MNERQNIGHVTKKVKVRRACWLIVYALFFRPFGTKLFRPWRVFLLRLFGAQIESGAEVYASAKIWAPWNLNLAAGSCIGPETIVYNQAMVTLGHHACLSQYAYICTAGHLTSEPNNADTGLLIAPVTLCENAWVGTRAFIGMGVVVGPRAIVGACACLFNDVEADTIVGGNPAQPINNKGSKI